MLISGGDCKSFDVEESRIGGSNRHIPYVIDITRGSFKGSPGECKRPKASGSDHKLEKVIFPLLKEENKSISFISATLRETTECRVFSEPITYQIVRKELPYLCSDTLKNPSQVFDFV